MITGITWLGYMDRQVWRWHWRVTDPFINNSFYSFSDPFIFIICIKYLCPPIRLHLASPHLLNRLQSMLALGIYIKSVERI